jgi:hypothetical protein
MTNQPDTALGGRFYGVPINLTVDNAVGHGLNHLALHVGLAPLDWRILPTAGDVVEGVPFPVVVDADAVCEAWARALNLSELPCEPGERVWVRVDAGWHVSVSTRRAA